MTTAFLAAFTSLSLAGSIVPEGIFLQFHLSPCNIDKSRARRNPYLRPTAVSLHRCQAANGHSLHCPYPVKCRIFHYIFLVKVIHAMMNL